MNSTKVGLLFLILSATPSLANVNLHTVIRGISAESLGERAGGIRFEVNGADFYGATKCTPYFVRIRLDKGVVLAETLVDVQTDTTDHVPINLACWLDGPSGATSAIEEDAVQIERWKAGEYGFWIRVNSPLWVRENGVIRMPDLSAKVSFALGISAQESAKKLSPLFETSCANLPSNQDTEGNPRHTFLMVHTLDTLFGEESPPGYLMHQLMFDTIAFDWQTLGVSTEEDFREIRTGDSTAVNFSGEDTIAILATQAPSTWIPHIARRTGPYDTTIHATNSSLETKPVTFIGYDFSGQIIGHQIRTIDPSVPWACDPHNLFPGRGVSHMEVRRGAEIWTNATYITHDGYSASVPEKMAEWMDFVLFPGDRGDTFDGMAVVNGGNEPAQWQLIGVGDNGQTLFSNQMAELMPGHKHVFLVEEHVPKNLSVAHYRITSSQPLAAMAIRGTTPGLVPGFLMELEMDAVSDQDVVTIERIIPHITPADGDYETIIDLVNLGEQEEMLTVTAFASTGEELESIDLDLQSALRRSVSSRDLLPGLPVSHLQITGGPSCIAGTRYRLRSGSGDSAYLPANFCTMRQWVMDTRHATWEFLGLVMVNAGPDPAPIELRLDNDMGTLLEQRFLDDPLPPNGKTTLLVGDIIEAFPNTGTLTISSPQLLWAALLRGSLPDQSIFFLGAESTMPPRRKPAAKEPALFFPDSRFKDFLLTRFDTDLDGEIRRNEIEHVTELDCRGNRIADLTGIEHFPDLMELKCAHNHLTSLPDLQLLSNLTDLDCRDNRLTALPDLGQVGFLENLFCDENQLKDLPDMAHLHRLQVLTCSYNQLVELPDLSSLTHLRYVRCSYNRLTKLPKFSVDTSQEHRSIEARNNYLDVGDCPDVREMQSRGIWVSYWPLHDGKDMICNEETCGPTPLVIIPDDAFKALLVRLFDMDGDGEINTCEASLVTNLNCSHEGISSLSGIGHFENLRFLDCSNNALRQLDPISALDQLISLDCTQNQLDYLPHLEGLSHLFSLDCSDNQLEHLPPLPPGLERLFCARNSLANINSVSNCELKNLDCSLNRLTSFPMLPASLEKLIAHHNSITALPDLSPLTQLRDLDCAHNQLTHLGDLSGLGNLKNLDCSGNRLSFLSDLMSQQYLQTIDCSFNQLTSLPMWSGGDYYRGLDLDCSHNQISAFPADLPVKRIRSLDCSHNQLTELPDFSLSWVHAIDCSFNHLTDLPLIPFRAHVPSPCLFAMGNNFDSDDCVFINEYQRQGPLEFIFNPQADGSVLECSVP